MKTDAKRYFTGPQVRKRYGGRSECWLWRRKTQDPHFPKPIVVGGTQLFDEDELDAYDASLRQDATEDSDALATA